MLSFSVFLSCSLFFDLFRFLSSFFGKAISSVYQFFFVCVSFQLVQLVHAWIIFHNLPLSTNHPFISKQSKNILWCMLDKYIKRTGLIDLVILATWCETLFLLFSSFPFDWISGNIVWMQIEEEKKNSPTKKELQKQLKRVVGYCRCIICGFFFRMYHFARIDVIQWR